MSIWARTPCKAKCWCPRTPVQCEIKAGVFWGGQHQVGPQEELEPAETAELGTFLTFLWVWLHFAILSFLSSFCYSCTLLSTPRPARPGCELGFFPTLTTDVLRQRRRQGNEGFRRKENSSHAWRCLGNDDKPGLSAPIWGLLIERVGRWELYRFCSLWHWELGFSFLSSLVSKYRHDINQWTKCLTERIPRCSKL